MIVAHEGNMYVCRDRNERGVSEVFRAHLFEQYTSGVKETAGH